MLNSPAPPASEWMPLEAFILPIQETMPFARFRPPQARSTQSPEMEHTAITEMAEFPRGRTWQVPPAWYWMPAETCTSPITGTTLFGRSRFSHQPSLSALRRSDWQAPPVLGCPQYRQPAAEFQCAQFDGNTEL